MNAPRASGFHHGVRSPSMYGRKRTPFAPTGEDAAFASMSAYLETPVRAASSASSAHSCSASHLKLEPAVCIVPDGCR